MAIATKPKPKSTSHKKRTGTHHKQTKHYHKSYWPYLPLILVVGLGLLLNSFLSHPRAVLGWQQNLNAEALLLETNNDRRDHTRPSLTLNQRLNQAAQSKAQDMVRKNYWSHTSPNGQQPWAFITAADYPYRSAGENLAYGFTSAKAVLNGWMHSEEHRANVLDGSYTEVGFGVAQSPNFLGKGSQIVVVAMYAAPTDDPAVLGQQQNGDGWLINGTDEVQQVSRLQAAAPMLSGIAIGIIGTLAVVIVLTRHIIAWRKLFRRGEKFILKHPIFDMTLVAIAMVAGILLQTAGFVG